MHCSILRRLVWWAAVVALTTTVAPVQSQRVNYTGSAQYATGSYIFAERTHSVYLTNGLHLSHRRMQVSVSLPIIYQSSPWVSYSIVGGVPSGGPQHAAVGRRSRPDDGMGTGRRRGRATIALPDTATYTDIGIGDPSLRADLTLLHGLDGRPGLQLTGSLKAPLADIDRGFGTGAWDGGLGAVLSQRIWGWFLFGDAIYWWMGDMDDLVLHNAVAYSIALGRSFRGGRVGVLASLSGYTASIVEDVAAPLQTGIGVSHSFDNGRYSLNVSAAFGLTESTPGASVALGWQVAL